MYFQNTILLQNTLLRYFCEEYPLKALNKKFSTLNYEKYNTHLQPHGILETYYLETKTLQKHIIYKNGKLDGLYKTYYFSGKLKEQKTYINGKENGEWKKYYIDGKLKESGDFINGELEGLYESYYENGTIEIRSEYKNNRLNGLYQFWDKNGYQNTKYKYTDGDLVLVYY